MSLQITSEIKEDTKAYILTMRAWNEKSEMNIEYVFQKPISLELPRDVEDVAQMTFRFLDKWGISLVKYHQYCKLNLGDDVTSSGSM